MPISSRNRQSMPWKADEELVVVAASPSPLQAADEADDDPAEEQIQARD